MTGVATPVVELAFTTFNLRSLVKKAASLPSSFSAQISEKPAPFT
jgi:hypothetical protein